MLEALDEAHQELRSVTCRGILTLYSVEMRQVCFEAVTTGDESCAVTAIALGNVSGP